jgi:hypothetical protein
MNLRNGKVVSADTSRNRDVVIHLVSTPQPPSNVVETCTDIMRKSSMKRLSYYIKQYQKSPFTPLNKVPILDKIVKETTYLIDILLPTTSHTRFVNMVMNKMDEWLNTLLSKKDHFSVHKYFKDMVRIFASRSAMCQIKAKAYYEKCDENHTPNTDNIMEKAVKLIGMCY